MTKTFIWLTIIVTGLILSVPLLPQIPIVIDKPASAEAKYVYGEMFLIALAVAGTGLIQYIKVYRPAKRLEVVMEETFDAFFSEPLKKLRESNRQSQKHFGYSTQQTLRLNVMKATRVAWFFGLVYRLKPIYHLYFENKHRDKYMSFFACKLDKVSFRWAQGACGMSFLYEEAIIADLRTNHLYRSLCGTTNYIETDFRLSRAQTDRTRHITGILSIPLFKQRVGKPPKVVGVINVDTDSSLIVDRLVHEKTFRIEWIEYFESYAALISKWL